MSSQPAKRSLNSDAASPIRLNSVYPRFLSTSYKGQLFEINFTSNLNTNAELKQEIDHIMYSVHLEG
jgi:hypothetical protein